MQMREAIQRALLGDSLDASEAEAVLRQMMSGEATDAQIAGFLIAMRAKGETVDELVGCAAAMRSLSARVVVDANPLLDTCGTGGTGANLFNVSTAVALVAAAAGVAVAKHGNRAASGNSGSADLLEVAGVRIDLEPEQVASCIERIGIGFMFAQVHHSAMRHTIGPRRDLGVQTLFNLLGPMTNPAGASHQIVGVPAAHWVTPMAEALGRLGAERALVLHSQDGLDEISCAAPTLAVEWDGSGLREHHLEPGQVGIALTDLAPLRVQTPQQSLELVQQALSGEPGPAGDTVALNAGAALWIVGAEASWEAGVARARTVLESGAAVEKLHQWAVLSNELAD